MVSLKTITLATIMGMGNPNSQAVEALADDTTDSYSSESVIEELTQSEAAARLQEAVDRYREDPKKFKQEEGKDLIRAMVIGGALQPADLATDDLFEVKRDLTDEETELMAERYKDLSAEFPQRYSHNKMNDEQVKEAVSENLVEVKNLNGKHIPMIIRQLGEEVFDELSEDDIQNLSFRYTRYYNDNVKNIEREDLVTVLNSSLGKLVMDKATGIDLDIKQAERIIADYENKNPLRVDLQKLGMSKVQLFAYALDKNIEKIDSVYAAELLGQENFYESQKQRGTIAIEGANPLSLNGVLDNMEYSAELCDKSLDYALDEKHLDISNSTSVFGQGGENKCSNIIKNVLDYSLGADRQNDPKHIDNYMEIVNKGGSFIEAGLKNGNKNYDVAGRFISDEVSQRGDKIDRKSALFLATPSFVRPEGWVDYNKHMQKLESVKSIMGAFHGAIVGQLRRVPYGSDQWSVDGNAKEIKAFYDLFVYENKQRKYEMDKDHNKKPTESELKYIKDMRDKYSKEPYSPTFIDDMLTYVDAVIKKCPDRAKDIKIKEAEIREAAQNFEKNNGIRLPDKITATDFYRQYDEIVGKGKSSKIDNTIEGQKRYLDDQLKKRNRLIYKGTVSKNFKNTNIQREKDLAYEGYFRGGYVVPQYYIGMLEDAHFNSNHFNPKHNANVKEDKKKLVADFGKWYAENKGRKGTLEFLADVLNTDKGQMFLEGMGENISIKDLKALEKKGILKGKEKKFILVFNKVQYKSKLLAETKKKADEVMQPEQKKEYAQVKKQNENRRTPPKGSIFDMTNLFIKDKTYS